MIATRSNDYKTHSPFVPWTQKPQLREAFSSLATALSTNSGQDWWVDRSALSDLEKSPQAWVRHFYPQRFSRPFTGYQDKFYDFIAQMQPDVCYQPRIECEPRGVGKSTNGRAAAVYLLAKKVKWYVVYVSATQAQAKRHFNAIRKMMENPRMVAAYPHLRPQPKAFSRSVANWSAQRLVTADGRVVEFVSILGNARGFNTEEGKRIDLFLVDDVDDQKDSIDVTEKKLDILGANILGAGDETTDVLMLQNLVHRTSICTRLRDNTAGILNNRHFVGPFPLCRRYSYTEEKIEGDNTGAKRFVVGADFQPYDPVTSREYVEILLNRLGPKRFERECQQNLSLVDDDKDFREWSEIHHVITFSEFFHYFNKYRVPIYSKERRRLQIPSQWNVGLGLDFGTTPEHPTGIFPVARPNKNVPLSNCFFVFGEVVLPEFPRDVNKQAELVSPRRVRVKEAEHLKKWNVRDAQVTMRRMSHEQSAARNAMFVDLEKDLQVFYNKWKAARGSGVPQMQNVMEIDYTKPHAFRRYPKNHPDKKKADRPIMGMPKFFLLVPDDQGRLMCDEAGHLYVAQGYNNNGCARFRAEIPVYSHRNTGKTKIFDDMVDAGRGLMGELVVMAQDMTADEQYRKKLEKEAPELLPENISKIDDDETKSLTIAREEFTRSEFDEQQRQGHRISDEGFGDYLDDVQENTGGGEEFGEL